MRNFRNHLHAGIHAKIPTINVGRPMPMPTPRAIRSANGKPVLDGESVAVDEGSRLSVVDEGSRLSAVDEGSRLSAVTVSEW